MGLLDSSTLTVNAILTTRGRELLSTKGSVDITKFALSDEEIDYTLHDRKHASGTNSFGVILDNTTILEASPNRSKLDSYLVDELNSEGKPQETSDIILSRLNYSGVDWGVEIGIQPKTLGVFKDIEEYIFTIENTNVVRFNKYKKTTDEDWESSDELISNKVNSWVAAGITVKSRSINPGSTTTVTIHGISSEVTKVISITVLPNSDVNIKPKPVTTDVTHPKFY
jgi:hypothetical protein|tara:strand:+ start:3716 stop:4393 length:678 start_codon:yes stop_codon:yes gene_type:complete